MCFGARFQILKEKKVPKQKLKMRAAALETMGDIFLKVGEEHKAKMDKKEGSDQEKREAAQQRVEKAMLDVLEMMDKAERDGLQDQASTSVSTGAGKREDG
jgi:hypothetical protein